MRERDEQNDIPLWRALPGMASAAITSFVLAAVGFIPVSLAVAITVLGGPLLFASFLIARRRKLGG